MKKIKSKLLISRPDFSFWQQSYRGYLRLLIKKVDKKRDCQNILHKCV